MSLITRSVAVLLLTILFLASITPCLSTARMSGPDFMSRGVLYVGGSGPNNYTSIQDAVDSASEDDTVYVYSGTYTEHVLISTPLILEGEAASSTIIDGGGSGNVVKILAQNVTVRHLTLQNGGIGAYIVFTSSCHILENIITDNWEGVGLLDTLSCEVSNNIITHNGFEGIAPTQTEQCTITNNLIVDHLQGIYLVESSWNLIAGNTIRSNTRGIESNAASEENQIFHNNFFSNEENNAYDSGSNTWDDGYPSGGNYWDDYNGQDNDHDGIGDTPYNIPNAGNHDDYPLMEPMGMPPAKPSDPVPADGSTNVSLNPLVSVLVSDPDGDAMDVSFYNAATQQLIATTQNVPSGTRASITWNGLSPQETYHWYATADDGMHTNQSATWTFQTGTGDDNQPPTAPAIDGPDIGAPHHIYTFTFNSSDPEESTVCYLIDWGDGTIDNWTSPSPSGQMIAANHTYPRMGTYSVKAKAKDSQGLEGSWGTLSVKMPIKPPTPVWLRILHWLANILESLRQHPFFTP